LAQVDRGGDRIARTLVPEAVAEVMARGQADGQPTQPGIGWPRARWLARFPESEALLTSLPDRLDRVTVRARCSSAATSPESAWQAFLVVVVWGFGTVGYGPWRTAQILAATVEAQERLASVAQQLAAQGASTRTGCWRAVVGCGGSARRSGPSTCTSARRALGRRRSSLTDWSPNGSPERCRSR
jgi:hypothetical protein